MFKWFKLYNGANPKTRYFVLNVLIYGLTLLITTIYCYARLDYVRSYPSPAVTETKEQENNKNPHL